MKIFQDIFNNEELLSDSYPTVETFEGTIYEVRSRMVVKGEDVIDVGCGNAFGGVNEDEEQGGSGGAPVEKVNDLVDAFQYGETSMDVDGFKDYFKGYMKKLLAHLKANKPERVAAFTAGASAFFKWAVANFGELSFYTGKGYDCENMLVMSYYKKEEDEAPHFLYIIDGLKFYKV
jgi:hypothetical protein